MEEERLTWFNLKASTKFWDEFYHPDVSAPFGAGWRVKEAVRVRPFVRSSVRWCRRFRAPNNLRSYGRRPRDRPTTTGKCDPGVTWNLTIGGAAMAMVEAVCESARLLLSLWIPPRRKRLRRPDSESIIGMRCADR